MEKSHPPEKNIWMFPKIVVPPNHPLKNMVFHYKPSILGYHFFWKHPYESTMILGNWKPLGFKEFQVDTTSSADNAYESS